MKLLRRRRLILLILVTIWLGGLFYFFMPLIRMKEENMSESFGNPGEDRGNENDYRGDKDNIVNKKVLCDSNCSDFALWFVCV